MTEAEDKYLRRLEEHVDYLEKHTKHLRRELEIAQLALMYAINKLENEIEVPDEFIESHGIGYALSCAYDPRRLTRRFTVTPSRRPQ